MQLGMIGLGRMGANMVRRLMRDGHECVAYDVNPTMSLLTSGWTAPETDLAARLPEPVASGALANQAEPTFDFMNEDNWGVALEALPAVFRLGVDPYTTNQALEGYDSAIRYLERTIRDYEKLADNHD